METKETKKYDSVMARIVIAIIILATIFTIYLTIKLIISGFTFR